MFVISWHQAKHTTVLSCRKRAGKTAKLLERYPPPRPFRICRFLLGGTLHSVCPIALLEVFTLTFCVAVLQFTVLVLFGEVWNARLVDKYQKRAGNVIWWLSSHVLEPFFLWLLELSSFWDTVLLNWKVIHHACLSDSLTIQYESWNPIKFK